MKYILYVLLLVGVINSSEAQKFKPSLNLAKGKTYTLSSRANSVIVQTVGGQQNTIKLDYDYRMAFKVTGVTDSVYSMEVSYQSLDMKMDMAGRGIEFNSEKHDPGDIPSTIVAAMMNKPFNVEMTKTGKIRSVTNIVKMVTASLGQLTGIDSAKKEQLKTMFLQTFGPSAFKGSLEVETAILPEVAVAKDDKWTVSTQLESPVKALVSMDYQLTDIAQGMYLIHGDGKIASDKNSPPVNINGLPVKYDLNGSVISDTRIDQSTGWLKEAKLKQVMMGSMHIADSPQVPGGMDIPVSFDTDLAITGN